MTREEILKAKQFIDCKREAKAKIRTCFYPGCNEKSINSHILQKNGILSSISKDRHLWEIGINPFKTPEYFPQKSGINNIFSFNCFCNKHDTDLFHEIEREKLDFKIYRIRFLFIIRTFYNELFRKLVGIDQYLCLREKVEDPEHKGYLSAHVEQMKLSLGDLNFIENLIWKDFNSNSESFVLVSREMEHMDFILSSFFDYETTEELNYYKISTGKDLERMSTIFVSVFPYEGKSILLMGYAKEDEIKVKSYFNEFLTVDEREIQRKLTNLMLFQCENWVCSEELYKERIIDNEEIFTNAAYFSQQNLNERKVFDLNIFEREFGTKSKIWNERYIR